MFMNKIKSYWSENLQSPKVTTYENKLHLNTKLSTVCTFTKTHKGRGFIKIGNFQYYGLMCGEPKYLTKALYFYSLCKMVEVRTDLDTCRDECRLMKISRSECMFY